MFVLGVVCAGVDARVAADVHRYKALPLVTGMGAYILSLTVNVLFKGIARPTVVEVGGVLIPATRLQHFAILSIDTINISIIF